MSIHHMIEAYNFYTFITFNTLTKIIQLMKQLLLSILFLGTIISNAQSLHITGLNATTVDGGINVNLHTTSLGGAGYLSDSYEIFGNIIMVKVCYWFDMSLPILQFEDNIMIPLEADGDYTVNVTVYNSSSQEACDDYSIAGSQSIVVSYLSATDFEKGKEHLKLFPNPTNGKIAFNNAIGINSITVYDGMGRLVKEFKHLATNTINLEGLSDGIYALHLEGEQGIHTQKIVFRN